MTKMLGASHWWGVCACEQCRNGRANKAEQSIYKRAQRRKEKREWRRGYGGVHGRNRVDPGEFCPP